MNIPVLDRSNYLKGLLITAKLDKSLTDKEKEIIKGISDKLGFATDFYNETIRSLLSNQYINEENYCLFRFKNCSFVFNRCNKTCIL